MDGEAIFTFKCGTAAQADQVAQWLCCLDWPDDLRKRMEDIFGSFEDVASTVFSAEAKGREVIIWATDRSSLDLMVDILDYAMQTWRSIPSPQGFTFGLARAPKLDPITYEVVEPGEYDGGAVLLRRNELPEIMIGSSWLTEQMMRAKQG